MFRLMVVTVFGLGKLRPAPGSWGSLPPCFIAIIGLLLDWPIWLTSGILLIVAGLSSVGCIALGRWAEERFKGKDPGVVVIDETAGMALALLFLPVVLPATANAPASSLSGYLIVIAAYVFFRIFDIIKIQPANLMQQFPHGWGILLDDLVAGLYTNVCLQITVRLVLPWLIS